MSDWFDATGNPDTATPGRSSLIRAEFTAVMTGISDKLPALSGNGGNLCQINSAGTAMVAVVNSVLTGTINLANTTVTADVNGILRVTASTLSTGRLAEFLDSSSSSSSRTLVRMGTTNVGSWNATVLKIEQAGDVASGGYGIYIQSLNGPTGNSLRIAGQQTNFDIINLPSATSLTTGSMINLVSGAQNTSQRDLIFVANQQSVSVNASCIGMQQSADAPYLRLTGLTGASTAVAFSTLTTSGAVTGHMQIEDVTGTKRWIAVLADPS